MREVRAQRSAPWVAASPGVRVLPPAARYILRGDEAVRRAVGAAFGVEVPASACRALSASAGRGAGAGERSALWLGPDEWLLLAPEHEAGAVETELAHALMGLPHSLVDVSHRQVALAAEGSQAALLLSAGCPLDLAESAFPVGMCTRTMLAKAEIVLWRTSSQAFRLEIWRSFAAYVSQFLAEAARGVI
ncbi:MAG: sarcosine oxidase subunit gamma [Gammaproteobacteria bacterium]|nr:sarcosine oxidase subunit gamma [Gammaproteobacteria bacterium]